MFTHAVAAAASHAAASQTSHESSPPFGMQSNQIFRTINALKINAARIPRRRYAGARFLGMSGLLRRIIREVCDFKLPGTPGEPPVFQPPFPSLACPGGAPFPERSGQGSNLQLAGAFVFLQAAYRAGIRMIIRKGEERFKPILPEIGSERLDERHNCRKREIFLVNGEKKRIISPP